MKKIVIIGANDFQNQLILKAKEMGFETHVFAWQDGSIGEKTADYFYPISIVETDAILEKCREIQQSPAEWTDPQEYYGQQGSSRSGTSGQYTGVYRDLHQ